MRNRPSTHFFLLLVLLVLNGLAYLAIYRAGVARGFAPSLLLAFRDLALFAPIFFVFIWLVRRHRYAGDMTLFTVAILLFGIGMFTQYRLFTDPEYSARGRARINQAREAKATTVQLRSANQYYDAEKKRAVFGDPNFKAPDARDTAPEERYWTLSRITTSFSTLIPLLALFGFAVAFSFVKRDDILLWLQRRSTFIGLVMTVPFIFIAVFLSEFGKSLGNTTPWEIVKVTFLVSYAGLLAANYKNLSRTNWGLPQWRFLLPFALIALLPIIPFFLLQDFGQMLVFLGAYVTLYVVAVRRLPQVVMAVVLIGLLFGAALLGFGIYNALAGPREGAEQVSTVERIKGFISGSVPDRVEQRVYLWRHGGVAPDPEQYSWWASRIGETRTDEPQFDNRNEELWYNSYAFQPAQALFGVSDGRLFGTGLGRGYPESIPIADSDYIYAVVAEEMGLMGGAIIILATIILVIAGLRTAIEAPDMFTKLLAAGIAVLLGVQAIVNIGGVLRMLPMTGITLPFVSHGGWSLITCFTMLGALMAISHRNNSVAAPRKSS
jgi:cell division protein FtsW (lipid II flippase)